MKKSISASKFSFLLLLLPVFYATRVKAVSYDPPIQGHVFSTLCCKNGIKIADSNDCTSSTTETCRNGKCNAGETEESSYCPGN